tara:strand:- start:1037 stop:1900 length:864 start_codon:yes stop_codon:yes gene_type:complete
MLELIGKKRKFAPIKSWFDSFTAGTPSVYPLILVGDSGAGKSTIATHYAQALGFDALISDAENERHTDALKRLFGDARKPTFFGQRRAVIVEDIETFSNKEWSVFDDPIKSKAFPMILITTNEAEIPWRIRKHGFVCRIENPDKSDLLQYLNEESPTGDQYHLQWIASQSTTWRQAKHLLVSTPDDWIGDVESERATRYGHAEIEDILLGRHDGFDFSSHPLAVIHAADFNGADPNHVIEAMLLHSKAWIVEGLSSISRAYISTLRANTTTKPPFRKRELKGSRRIV